VLSGARPPNSAKLIAPETEMWAKVVKLSGAKTAPMTALGQNSGHRPAMLSSRTSGLSQKPDAAGAKILGQDAASICPAPLIFPRRNRFASYALWHRQSPPALCFRRRAYLRTLTHHHERRPVGGMRLVRFALVDQHQQRAPLSLRPPTPWRSMRLNTHGARLGRRRKNPQARSRHSKRRALQATNCWRKGRTTMRGIFSLT
jgi:hypothetical protein